MGLSIFDEKDRMADIEAKRVVSFQKDEHFKRKPVQEELRKNVSQNRSGSEIQLPKILSIVDEKDKKNSAKTRRVISFRKEEKLKSEPVQRECRKNVSQNSSISEIQIPKTLSIFGEKDRNANTKAKRATSFQKQKKFKREPVQKETRKKMTQNSSPSEFLHEIIHKGITLNMHKLEQGNSRRIKSKCVTLFLQRGRYQHKKLLEPRLVWNRDEGKNDENCINMPLRSSMNLLDIASVEKASTMIINSYPFAQARNSFFLATYSGSETLFEARCHLEQERIVHCLQDMMIKFAFQLISGNKTKCSIFFDGVGSISTEDVSSLSLRDLVATCSTNTMNDITNKLVDKSVFQQKNISLL